jgi:hypothetical protein
MVIRFGGLTMEIAAAIIIAVPLWLIASELKELNKNLEK